MGPVFARHVHMVAVESVSVESFVTGGIPIGSNSNSTSTNTTTTATTPLVLFHGSTTIQPELFKAQVTALAAKIQQRLDYSPAASSSDTTKHHTALSTSKWIQNYNFFQLFHGNHGYS